MLLLQLQLNYLYNTTTRSPCPCNLHTTCIPVMLILIYSNSFLCLYHKFTSYLRSLIFFSKHAKGSYKLLRSSSLCNPLRTPSPTLVRVDTAQQTQRQTHRLHTSTRSSKHTIVFSAYTLHLLRSMIFFSKNALAHSCISSGAGCGTQRGEFASERGRGRG